MGFCGLSKWAEHDPVNIGNPNEFTILQCAAEVQRLVGTDAEIVFKPLPKDDPKQRQPDISKARRLLGWEPKVPLREGLARSMEYFKAAVQGEKQSVANRAERDEEYFRLAAGR